MTAPTPSPEALMALAETVSRASGANRDMDALIAPHHGLRVVDEGYPFGRCCYDSSHRAVILPRYTASLDAAMTLVPEGWWFDILGASGEWPVVNFASHAEATLALHTQAKTAALALLAAALKARALAATNQEVE